MKMSFRCLRNETLRRFKIDGVHRIMLVATTAVKKGDWLLMNYALEPIFRARGKDSNSLPECFCESSACHGFVEGMPENQIEYPKIATVDDDEEPSTR